MKLFDERTHQVVQLPAELVSFRDDPVRVLAIVEDSAPGRSGKLLIESPHDPTGKVVYPGVVRGYIADEARVEVPA